MASEQKRAVAIKADLTIGFIKGLIGGKYRFGIEKKVVSLLVYILVVKEKTSRNFRILHSLGIIVLPLKNDHGIGFYFSLILDFAEDFCDAIFNFTGRRKC